MLKKLFEKLYPNIFVSIATIGEETHVGIETFGSKKEDYSHKTFDTLSFSEAIANYIKSFTDNTPFFYITYLSLASAQGALSSCAKVDNDTLIDYSLNYTVCNNNWMAFAPMAEVDKMKNKYASVGLDYIISPFMMLETLFIDKMENDTSLYVLMLEETLCLMVMCQEKMLYARFIDENYEALQSDEGIDSDIEVLKDEGLDLDDDGIGFDLDGIDDFGDIEDLGGDLEDLDMIDEIEDFTDESDVKEESSKSDELSLDEFNQEFKNFKHIQNCIEEFYKDENYQSEFIEKVYIANATDKDEKEIKSFLEDELFLKVVIRSVDINKTLIDMTKIEANYV